MALTLTLAYKGVNRLRYLVAYDGDDTVKDAKITTISAVENDLITDSFAGPIRNIATVYENGYGTFASGAQTTAKSKALLLSDWSGAQPGAQTAPVQTPTLRVLGQAIDVGDGVFLEIDAAAVANHPAILVGVRGTLTSPASFYLDVEMPGPIGV
jgi:hypothetical protein